MVTKPNQTIYVQIASYRDPQLIPTILDMVDKASNPENLHIGICWQHDDETETIEDFLDNKFEVEGYDIDSHPEFNKIEMSFNGARLSLLDVPRHDSQGACWARHSIQQMYDKETYTLQLDSHHRFVENWDTISIEMLESIRSDDSPKPLLTGYIPSFNPTTDPKGRVQEAWKMNFDRFIPEGAVFFLPATIDGWKNIDEPVKARFYSAHFCFTDGIFCEEVQHDPEYFFHGEEISIAVRAFTHGYDLYHPNRIIAWHEYTREGRVKIWDDHTHKEKKEGLIKTDWHERNMACHARNRILFGMDGNDPTSIDFGKYGFGKKRTLREYEEYAGISFEYRGVQQATLDNLSPPNNFEYSTEEEWKNSFAVSNDIRICFSINDIADFCEDYDFFYVGAHDKDGKELYRKDLSEAEIKNYFNKGEWVDYQFIFQTTEIPATYSVWPHSKSKGWMTKITKPVDYYTEK